MMGTLFNSLFGVQVDGNDEPIKTQHLSENEDQNHSYEETWLLGCASDTGITNNTYGKSSSQPTESYSQPCTQVDKPPENKNNNQSHSMVSTSATILFKRGNIKRRTEKCVTYSKIPTI